MVKKDDLIEVNLSTGLMWVLISISSVISLGLFNLPESLLVFVGIIGGVICGVLILAMVLFRNKKFLIHKKWFYILIGILTATAVLGLVVALLAY